MYAKDTVTIKQEHSAWDSKLGETTHTSRSGDSDGDADYFGRIGKTQSFQWLTWRINRYFKLDFRGVRKYGNTGLDVARRLEEHRQHDSSNHYVRLDIRLQFDISDFHRKQGYECDIPEMLEKAVVLTGYDESVQATTCREYVSQTWGDEGLEILHMLQRALYHFQGKKGATDHSGGELSAFPSQRRLEVTECSSYLNVRCVGMPDYLLIVAASLLSWLGASLQEPSAHQKVKYISPHPSVSDVHDGDISFSCRLFFRLPDKGRERLRRESPTLLHHGFCWLGLFEHVVIAKGFPILLRETGLGGLELSMELMSALTGATYLVNFGNRTFIKGFSTMLAVTGITDSIVLWHFLHNDEDEYIPYNDARLPDAKSTEAPLTLSLSLLKQRRHIVGWSHKAVSMAGKTIFIKSKL